MHSDVRHGESGEPPATLHLKWCDKCGRTDRHSQLSARHFYLGHECRGGTIREAEYVPRPDTRVALVH